MAASQALSTALFCEQWSCTVSLSHQVDGRKKKLNVIVCVCVYARRTRASRCGHLRVYIFWCQKFPCRHWQQYIEVHYPVCVILQEVALRGHPESLSIPPPQYYSQLITEMEMLGWDK